MTKLLQNEAEVDLNITYVFIVNQDLNMSPEKMASQVAHVAIQLGVDMSEPHLEGPNTAIVGRNIVLYAPEDYMFDLLNNHKEELGVKYVIDSGFTENTKNKLTCLGFIRTPESLEYTKNLKSKKK